MFWICPQFDFLARSNALKLERRGSARNRCAEFDGNDDLLAEVSSIFLDSPPSPNNRMTYISREGAPPRLFRLRIPPLVPPPESRLKSTGAATRPSHQAPMSPHRIHRGADGAPPAGGRAAHVGQRLHDEAPEVRELLESLDDAIFGALGGCESAMQKTRQLWPNVVASLGWDLVEESQEQYLRYAVEVTRRFESQEVRDPALALAALEVIELLTRGGP
jgi:hypothetical protein